MRWVLLALAGTLAGTLVGAEVTSLDDAGTGSLRWADLPWLPLYPTIYLAYAFIRGLMTGTYPYPFLNLQEKGIAGVAPTVLAILVLFLITGLILIYLDRRKSVQ